MRMNEPKTKGRIRGIVTIDFVCRGAFLSFLISCPHKFPILSKNVGKLRGFSID